MGGRRGLSLCGVYLFLTIGDERPPRFGSERGTWRGASLTPSGRFSPKVTGRSTHPLKLADLKRFRARHAGLIAVGLVAAVIFFIVGAGVRLWTGPVSLSP